MEFNTLQDFLIFTKGQEYLIALGSIFLFTGFWVFLNRNNKKND